MINKQLVLSKTEELELPIQNVVAGAVMEHIIKVLVESGLNNNFWLRQSKNYSLASYSKQCIRKMPLSYVGTEELSTVTGMLQKEIIAAFESEGIKVQIGASPLSFQLTLDDIYLPIQIEVEKALYNDILPKEEKQPLFMENKQVILVKTYPQELEVAENLALILQKLELIDDMRLYLLVYEALHQEVLEGRRLKDALQLRCNMLHVNMTEKPLEIWKSYGDYTYMKKKWKAFLRQKNKSEPEWKDCFENIKTFLEPVWTAVCEDDIFFMDWMPDLQRFFD